MSAPHDGDRRPRSGAGGAGGHAAGSRRRRGRRRVERPSTAPFVDRSWDQPGAEELFSLGDRQRERDQPRRDRDTVADGGEDGGELTKEFWLSEKPPHWG